ncbi:hypothetical protein WA026_004182 [Henosepilachna vigintioctopunctata]|uniref:Anaphase-promoting complex subunit 2 n=1 Tax=Henosepilachna vigintioctopunctata TaxID=420089 RepID=A0AAW1UHY0_9CUCU
MQEVDVQDAWIFINKIFPILNSSYPTVYTKEEFYKAAKIIKELNLTCFVQDMVILKIETSLRKSIIPKFWSHFKSPENIKPFYKFLKAIDSLYEDYSKLLEVINALDMLRNINNFDKPIMGEMNIKNSLKLMLKSTMFSQHHTSYDKVISYFYEEALLLEDMDSFSSKQCPICSLLDCSNCETLFLKANGKLIEMSLLGPLTDQALTDLIYYYINMHIQKTCKDNFDTSYIESFEKWLDRVIITWLKKIYCHSEVSDRSIADFDKKLRNYLYNTYTKIRINQLFNIIIEYPDSLAALEDIKICLPKTDLKQYLIKKLQQAVETRLLHLGVSTSDVLTAYVAAIRSLRFLDPSGLLLEVITQPIHQYLRSREDTVRCVVSSLTEEGPNDLAEELVRGETVLCDENTIQDSDENWETWTPESSDHQPSKIPATKRSSDIISMLVNVYGSKELFVNEYRTLLADRLLCQYSCDTEKEIRYLELLKLRFGDSQLHYCEVMLKDIVDSKRINQHIKQDPNYKNQEIPISTMIVSAQFWPPFKEEKLELHPKLLTQFESFTKGFETLKGSRTLCWKNHLGIVDLEIELSSRTLSLSVSPVHATIMMHFQDSNRWTLNDLSKTMQVPPTVLRRKIGFWQSHGLLVENEQDIFLLKEETSEDNIVQDNIIIEDYESESAMASAQDQRDEELQTFWSYIVGMLMNLDTLSLERIHQMLKMFALQGSSVEYNIHELKIFLDKKVREHQLIHSNGLYKLPK